MDENTEQITAAEEGDFAGKSVLRKEVILREEGRSLLPVSRVQRIIKADKELPLVAKEAVFAISIATEEFIKRITLACYRQAEREKRVTIQRKDIALVAKRADEFFFLEGATEEYIAFGV
ncbi:histone-fold-containing [Pyrrhoderma noxium]|uniref:Histone-fold-containing n=1 Tax=Pyrrhoderma noxium TaxID=2282107 RepID=A0A286UBE9_9AGAM|nr:histone-fold-containing [Pyrrhoderma noxium]